MSGFEFTRMILNSCQTSSVHQPCFVHRFLCLAALAAQTRPATNTALRSLSAAIECFLGQRCGY